MRVSTKLKSKFSGFRRSGFASRRLTFNLPKLRFVLVQIISQRRHHPLEVARVSDDFRDGNALAWRWKQRHIDEVEDKFFFRVGDEQVVRIIPFQYIIWNLDIDILLLILFGHMFMRGKSRGRREKF